jgi:hypothetical protein
MIGRTFALVLFRRRHIINVKYFICTILKKLKTYYNNKMSFWLEDPSILFSDFVLFPNKEMNKSEKLNALTRLAVLLTILLYFLKWPHWHIFLLCSLILVLILQYGCKAIKETHESFSVTPLYTEKQFLHTVVPPMFAEEHQLIPPQYDIIDTEEPTYIPENTFHTPTTGQTHPYRQYITPLNMLPSDAAKLAQFSNLKDAREYVNGALLRDDLAFREEMSRLRKKKVARRRGYGNLNDTFSPFHSY